MARMKDDNIARPIHRLSGQQWVRGRRGEWTRSREDSGIIVDEGHCGVIDIVLLSPGTLVSRTEIACGIVLGKGD